MLVFIFCQSFSIVAEVYEFVCIITDANGGATFCESNIHIENFIDVSHFMLAVNASVNFIFYMAHIPQFRETFIKVRMKYMLCLEKIGCIIIINDCVFNDDHDERYQIYDCFSLIVLPPIAFKLSGKMDIIRRHVSL